MVDPGRVLREPEDEWDRTYDRFDMSVWRDCANFRFGEKAAVEVIDILRGTPRLVEQTLTTCGSHFLCARFNVPDTRENREWFKRLLTHPYRSLLGVAWAIERCGRDLARAEKAQAMRFVQESLARIEKMKPILRPGGYENLHGAFDRSRYIVAIYQAMVEAVIAALEVDEGSSPRERLKKATDDLRAAADAATAVYSDRLLEGTPIAAHAVAEFIDEMPGKMKEYLATYERQLEMGPAAK
jgi:hypothetical protein